MSTGSARSCWPAARAAVWLLLFALVLSACTADAGDPTASATASARSTPNPATPRPVPSPDVAAPTDTPASPADIPVSPADIPASASPAAAAPALAPAATPLPEPVYEIFDVPPGTRPHDVAPAVDGGVWYTAQRTGRLGHLDPASGDLREIALGVGSAPHGVIVGPDGAPWVTDGGLNAIVRVNPADDAVDVFPLQGPYANLNTAAFDEHGVLWFTGQEGIYGRLDPSVGEVEVFDAPRGEGPYGIAATPEGVVWLASLAGSYIGRIDGAGGLALLEVPTDGGGARRVWSDRTGRLWVTQWFAGRLAMFDPATDTWSEWDLPGTDPRPYAVWVDERDDVWVSDFGSDALLRFDAEEERFEVFPYPPGSDVRQILGRPGEVWGAGSGTDTLIVLRTGA